MKIYNYDKDTKVLTTVTDARPDPLTEGAFLIPANATNITPPPPRSGFTFAFDNDKWVPIEDHRGQIYYNKTTGEKMTITEVGPVSNEYTPIKYIPNAVWVEKDNAWELPLAFVKDEKIIEINSKAKEAIIRGFSSSALGTVHEYQSDTVDQLNLIGIVTTGVDSAFKAGVKQPDGSVVWSMKPHTITELKTVLLDGKKHKENILIKASTLKESVLAATTVAKVNIINW